MKEPCYRRLPIKKKAGKLALRNTAKRIGVTILTFVITILFLYWQAVIAQKRYEAQRINQSEYFIRECMY